MNIIIQSSIKTLQKTRVLLSILSDDELSNASVAPYYSGIGSHIRHILDFYDCALNITSENKIDLTNRSRNSDVETKCDVALQYLDQIINKLESIEGKIDYDVIVIDDLGLGKIEMKYTFEALIAQANSHTIHHYAIINYILESIGIKFGDDNFGFNPTTPKKAVLN
ncbi:hypothetical protein MNBD_BACTEROID02-1295 [hydrothermal vent metagenome]|uniref:DinB family protein n=1 Tax=hydrothermal vent metagenome TaxID=652676 RepID=A0A3B0QXF8_9ZZZZ